MFIETTLYVHRSILNTLSTRAAKTGISRTSIINHLMQRVMKDDKRMIKTCSRVQYQKRDRKEYWTRIHIFLNEYEYEYYLDLRKFLKMSVSLILAYAVLMYLDELTVVNMSVDNYFFRNYIFIKKTVDGIVCWQIYWGVPTKFALW